jgi:hypothetical protein
MWLGFGVLISFVVVLWVLMRLSLFLSTVLLNMVASDLRPLPADVLITCSINGCDDLATKGTPDVTDSLHKKGTFLYVEGSKPSVYCTRHSIRFSDMHPVIRRVVSAAMWICAVYCLFAITR